MNGLHVACEARLGADPEQRFTRTGKVFLTVSAVVSENSMATEQRVAPETQWVRVTAWEQQAGQLADVLQQGCEEVVNCNPRG